MRLFSLQILRRVRERDALEERADDLEATIDAQADRINELHETRIVPENWEQAEEAVRRLADAFDLGGAA